MLRSRGLGLCGCCCRKICVGHVSLSGPLQPEPLVCMISQGSLRNGLPVVLINKSHKQEFKIFLTLFGRAVGEAIELD